MGSRNISRRGRKYVGGVPGIERNNDNVVAMTDPSRAFETMVTRDLDPRVHAPSAVYYDQNTANIDVRATQGPVPKPAYYSPDQTGLSNMSLEEPQSFEKHSEHNAQVTSAHSTSIETPADVKRNDESSSDEESDVSSEQIAAARYVGAFLMCVERRNLELFTLIPAINAAVQMTGETLREKNLLSQRQRDKYYDMVWSKYSTTCGVKTPLQQDMSFETTLRRIGLILDLLE